MRRLSASRLATLLALACLAPLVPLSPVAVAAAPTKTTAATGKGPVGWDTYRRLDRMSELRPGSMARQFSSFDRTGGNHHDGFDGRFSCLRTDPDGCVLAEHAGAGEVTSVWFTRDWGVVTRTGRIRIDLDGHRVVDAPLQDVVNGKLGAPFAWPLVGNGEDTVGGVVIKVPMPFQRSMKVSVEHNPLFYHVNYRTFADARGVPTFDPKDKAEDVLATLRTFGLRDPKPAAKARTLRWSGQIAAGQTARLAELGGSGQIAGLRLRLPQAVRSPYAVDDGRAFGAGGSSMFTARIDPANTGVRLTRRYDPRIGNQRAEVLVDGRPVGEWRSGARQPEGQWADQSIDLPAELTRGRSQLTVTNRFVSSDLDVNEFGYDVSSRLGEAWTRTDLVDVGPNHPGEESAHGYRIAGQHWQGQRASRYPVSDQVRAASDQLLAGARLRITFDGNTTVDAPVGEFFGSGLGGYETRSLLFAIDATGPGGWYSAWWPMPYGAKAVVELVNASGQPITGAAAEVVAEPAPSAAGLRSGRLGYFHATHRHAPVEPRKDWSFLSASGQGVFYGVTHSMRGLIPTGNRRNYLEGDERVHVDGVASPSLYGTGTEDFYESGWYFRDVADHTTTYAMPLVGHPSYERDGDGCQYDCNGTYRLMLPDAVSFTSALRFGIEHGSHNTDPVDYSSTAYWYGQATAASRSTDEVDVTDEASRAAHGYQAAGETRSTLDSTFEGESDQTRVAAPVTAATGAITFRLKLDNAHQGARLVRRGDQASSQQAVAVEVDGRPVGTWRQPLGNEHSRWLEDTFDLPALVTAGRSQLTLRLVPVAGAPAWSAASYRVLSLGVAGRR